MPIIRKDILPSLHPGQTQHLLVIPFRQETSITKRQIQPILGIKIPPNDPNPTQIMPTHNPLLTRILPRPDPPSVLHPDPSLPRLKLHPSSQTPPLNSKTHRPKEKIHNCNGDEWDWEEYTGEGTGEVYTV
jgi:hypothetical protein